MAVIVDEPARLVFVANAATGEQATFTMTFDAASPPLLDGIAVQFRRP